MGATLADGGDLEGSQAVSHVEQNRLAWTKAAAEYAERAPIAWASEPTWGIWHVAEAELRVLPDVDGKDVVELGCGTAYWSAWLARLGAKPVGVDVTPAQLETARRMQEEFALEFPLVEASAESVPLPDGSFDIAFSEYGASIWCDPYLWVPEAARLLRPGGELIFLVNGTILMLCMNEDDSPATDHLVRDYFGMHRFEWPSDDGIDFHIGYGEWIRLLGANGFEVEDMIEIQAPADAEETRYPFVKKEWARRWPSEEIWKARKR
jgi:SAM-dependent methyltransferase